MACSKPVKEKISSQIPAEKREFTWEVDHWAAIQKSKEMLDATSVQFEMGASIGLPITVRVFLQEWNEEEMAKKEDEEEIGKKERNKSIGIYFQVVDSPPGVSPIMMDLYCCSNHFITPRSGVKDFTVHVLGCEFMAQDTDPARLPLDSKGSLPIDVEVTLYNVKAAVSKILPPSMPPPVPVVTAATLMAKWKEPFLQKLLQDKDDLRKTQGSLRSSMEMVTLVSKEGKEMRVNGLVLAERSPVFRKMLKFDYTGNRVVKLEEIGVEALDLFFTFLQTATLPEDKWKQPGILEELAMAAHKYQVPDLLEFLEEALEIVCTPKNCTTLIVLAKTLGLKKAEKALLEKYREEWKEAGDLEKMRELFESAAVAVCPKQHVKVKDSSKMAQKLKKVVSSFL